MCFRSSLNACRSSSEAKYLFDRAHSVIVVRSEPAVEPDGTVERRLLVDEDVLQVVAERLQILLGGKVLVRSRPLGDRRHDAADQLLDAALTLRRADLPAEILRDDDVGRLLRPGLRH